MFKQDGMIVIIFLNYNFLALLYNATMCVSMFLQNGIGLEVVELF